MNLDTATHVDAALHLVNCNAVGSPHIVELHISQCRFKCKLKHHCTEIPVPKGVEGIVWGSSTYMGRGTHMESGNCTQSQVQVSLQGKTLGPVLFTSRKSCSWASLQRVG